uniref:hypothetical protein n=1 Tax=Oceanicola sp. S124 TaxID=1042378 RepID=UPI00192C5017
MNAPTDTDPERTAATCPGPSSMARGMAGDAQTELDSFLDIITHDLRATFRAFQTIPEWIREDMGPLPPDQATAVGSHIDMLITQASRCDRML